MVHDFYNKVAKKFGKYSTGAKRITEYPEEDPEKVFKKKLLEVSGKDKTVLDVGCADGRFTLFVAPKFKKVVAIDLSEGMLKAARELQKEKGVENVSFEKQDAFHTTYADASFDAIYSRRGPSNFTEGYRLLKSSGHFVEIDIGEKDCQELKEVFGRGQNFGEWDNPRIKVVKEKLKNAGLEIVFAKDYFYDEYYASYEDLDLFLHGVPIFEDYDSQKDKQHLEEYVTKFTIDKGIKLLRHRVVSVSRKI